MSFDTEVFLTLIENGEIDAARENLIEQNVSELDLHEWESPSAAHIYNLVSALKGSYVRTLHLSDPEINAMDKVLALRGIRKNDFLQKINLFGNAINTHDLMWALYQAPRKPEPEVEKQPSIESSQEYYSPPSPPQEIRDLYKLDLGGNFHGLDDTGFSDLIENFMCVLNEVEVTSLGLADNDLGLGEDTGEGKQGKLFCLDKILRSFPKIHELDLSGNKINSDAALSTVGDMLKNEENQHITSLDFSHNFNGEGIDKAERIRFFADAIIGSNLKTLRFADIDNNCVDAVIYLLEQNPNIQSLGELKASATLTQENIGRIEALINKNLGFIDGIEITANQEGTMWGQYWWINSGDALSQQEGELDISEIPPANMSQDEPIARGGSDLEESQPMPVSQLNLPPREATPPLDISPEGDHGKPRRLRLHLTNSQPLDRIRQASFHLGLSNLDLPDSQNPGEGEGAWAKKNPQKRNTPPNAETSHAKRQGILQRGSSSPDFGGI